MRQDLEAFLSLRRFLDRVRFNFMGCWSADFGGIQAIQYMAIPHIRLYQHLFSLLLVFWGGCFDLLIRQEPEFLLLPKICFDLIIHSHSALDSESSAPSIHLPTAESQDLDCIEGFPEVPSQLFQLVDEHLG